ncbi:MAG TPA: mechanosensitive ion channel family protein [Thermoplasmata archaeon]|nr:mechanosensitive ion channel family protein [Thermoplasmata archaeon]
MIAIPPWSAILWPAIVGGAIAAIVWVVSSVLIRRTRWSTPVQQSVLSVFHGPVTIGVAVATASQIEARFWNADPSAYPPPLEPAAFVVFLELIVLWSILAVATGAVRRHVLTDQHPSGRYLILGIYTAGLLGLVYVLLNSPVVPHLQAGIWATFGFFAGLVGTYIAVHVVNVVVDRYFRSLVAQRPHLQTIYTFLRRVVIALVILVGVAVSTYTNFPEAAGTVTSLILAAGFLSIVIGLAAQSSVSNMIAGALISVSQPFELGDAVVYAGEFCFVEDIRLVFTVLRTWDNRRLMVPNSMFQSSVVINYTATDPTMLAPLVIDITYESDVDVAMRIMREEALKHPDCLPIGTLPQVVVMEYKDSGVSLRLLSRAKDQSTAFQMERDLLYTIRKRFQAEGVGLPYPTRRVIVEQAPAASRG